MGTFTVGQQAARIYSKGLGSGCIANLDLTNTLYFGSDDGLTTASDTIPPLGAIVVDGSTTLYGATLSGAQIQVQATPGASSWTPSPAQVAAQINALGLATATNQQTQLTTGQPVTHGIDNLANQNHFVAAGGSVTVGPLTVSRPGYVVQFWANYDSASGSVPFVSITMEWLDSATGHQTALETWYIPVSTLAAGGISVYGKGPTKGNTVKIIATNIDSVQPVDVEFIMWETSHHIARDDWRGGSPAGSIVPGIPGAPCDPFAGLLINDVANLNAGLSASFLLPLYAGQGSFYVNPTGAGTLKFSAFGIALGGIYNSNGLGSYTLAAAVPQQLVQEMGRWPVLLTVTNTTGSAQTYTITGVILEYAS